MVQRPTAPKLAVIGREIAGRLSAQALQGMTIEFAGEHAGDRTHQLVLDREDILHVASFTLRPQLFSGGGFEKLRGDAEAIARPSHATFHHITGSELTADLHYIDRLPLEGE